MLEAVLALVGGMVGMGCALGCGFKLMVDVVSKQLGAQNAVIAGMQSVVAVELPKLSAGLESVRLAVEAAERTGLASADAARSAASASASAAARVVGDSVREAFKSGKEMAGVRE